VYREPSSPVVAESEVLIAVDTADFSRYGALYWPIGQNNSKLPVIPEALIDSNKSKYIRMPGLYALLILLATLRLCEYSSNKLLSSDDQETKIVVVVSKRNIILPTNERS
jgi:hypothetical protein